MSARCKRERRIGEYAPDVSDYRGPGRDEIPVDFIVFEGAMRYAHRQNHVPSHGFFDDCVDVDEVVSVGMVRKAAGADDGV